MIFFFLTKGSRRGGSWERSSSATVIYGEGTVRGSRRVRFHLIFRVRLQLHSQAASAERTFPRAMPRRSGALSGALAPVLLGIFGVERCSVAPAPRGPSDYARGCGAASWGSGSFNPTRRHPATPPIETDVVPEVACCGDGSRVRGFCYAFAMKLCITSCAAHGERDASFRSSAAAERESGSCRCRSGNGCDASDKIGQLQLLLRLRGGEGPCPHLLLLLYSRYRS